MSPYAVIILIALLTEYGLSLVASRLNLQALQRDLPDGLRGLYDEAEYRRSQIYTRAQTRWNLIAAAFDLGVLLLFWFSGGFEWLDTLVRSWSLGPVPTGLAYIGILGAAKGVLSLPFQLYETFGIEERFGFNKTTPRTFVLDRIKGIGLAIVLGGPLLALVLWFFNAAGPYAWVYAWVSVTAFALLAQFVAPRLILPLFNTFDPLDEGELRDRILDYARSVNFSVGDVFQMDGSHRSRKSNAFFTGLGRYRRVVLFDTLVEQHTPDELLAVVAHEVGHYKRHHIPQRMAISVLHTGVLFLLLSFFLQAEGLYTAFYVDQMSVYTGLIFFGLLYSPVSLLLSIPLQAWSRRHEFEADRFAIDTTGQPQALAEALKKLAAHNLSNLTPHPLYVRLHYSHPPLRDRIAAIQEYAARGALRSPSIAHSTTGHAQHLGPRP